MRYHKPAKRMMKTTSSVVVVRACRVSPSSTMRVILLAKYVDTFKGFDFASSLLSVSKVELLCAVNCDQEHNSVSVQRVPA